MKADKIRKTVMFCCGGYRSVYAGNFIPSLLGIEEKLAPNNPCVYVFHRATACRPWCKKLIRDGHRVEFMDFDAGLLRRMKQIGRICRKHGVSLIHVHFGDRCAAALYGTLSGIQVVWHYHTDDSCGRAEKWSARFAEAVRNDVLGWNVKKIAVSKSLASKQKAQYVPNGLAISRIDRYEEQYRQQVRKTAQISDRELLILLFGWTPERKGLDIACDAVKIVRENVNVKLAVVCGEDVDVQKRFLKERCGWRDTDDFIYFWPPRENVYRYHNMADIFLSASRSEGFPYGLLEALSIGKPCVVSDLDATAWTEEFSSVEFFETGDAASLAKAMEAVIARMEGENGRFCEADAALVREKYSAELWAERVIRIYGFNHNAEIKRTKA